MTAKDVLATFTSFALIFGALAIAATVSCFVNYPESYAPIAARFMKAYNAEMLKP